MSKSKILSKSCLALTVSLGAACGTVSVTSTPPEAEVQVVLPGKETRKLLGKTPYSADLADLEELVNEGTLVLIVSKNGYISQPFVVPNLSGGDLKIEANLRPNLPSNYKEINRIVGTVLEAERHLLQNRLDEALKAAEEIKKINENVSTAYEIEATAYFLKKDFEKSRFAWIRALELEPNNPEAQAMLAKVEEKLGIVPAPAAAKGSAN